MKGKAEYVQAILDLNNYVSSVHPEIAAIESQLESIHVLTGGIDKQLEDRLFTKKAECLQHLLTALESGVKFLPAREVQ